MKMIGICIAMFGFMLTIHGNHPQYVAMIATGILLYIGGLYIEKR